MPVACLAIVPPDLSPSAVTAGGVGQSQTDYDGEVKRSTMGFTNAASR